MFFVVFAALRDRKQWWAQALTTTISNFVTETSIQLTHIETSNEGECNVTTYHIRSCACWEIYHLNEQKFRYGYILWFFKSTKLSFKKKKGCSSRPRQSFDQEHAFNYAARIKDVIWQACKMNSNIKSPFGTNSFGLRSLISGTGVGKNIVVLASKFLVQK